MGSGRTRPSEAQLQLRELDVRPGRRLRLARSRIESETHRGDRSFTIADELARVRDPRVRGEARTERDHALEGGKGIVVAAELDEGVADDAVRTRRAGQQPLGAAAVLQRRAKLVLDERERAEPENRVGIVDAEANGPPQRGFGARKVRGIGGLPPAQLICESELRQKCGVPRLGPHLRLERHERRCADAAGRSRERPICERHGSCRRRRCRPRLGEDAADEPPESERGRSRAAHEECRTSSHAEPLPFPTCVPCARSPGWAPRRRGTSRGTGCLRSYPPRPRSRCSGCGSRCRRRTRIAG